MASTLPPAPPRIVSIDAYRGFVMLLMLMEVLHLSGVAKKFPDSAVWRQIGYHTTHVEWVGCSLHDLIQPSFSFLVGVALPFSLAARRGRGEPLWRSLLHAGWRAVALSLLGIFLRTVSGRFTRTHFTFEDTLTQIGLGYFPLFLIALLNPKWWWVALAVIVVGYWGAFAAYPLPDETFSYEAVGVKAEWAKDHHAHGLAAHWNKNSNLAWKVDTGFLNLFPREPKGAVEDGQWRPKDRFEFNGGGYSTLSFIPTLGTMILGLIAGGWLRTAAPDWTKIGWLVLAGAIGLAAGRALGDLGVCPVVKRIWTPSWVLFSGGWCFLLLALFHALTAGIGYCGWTYPLRVIGANSILIYVIADTPIGGWLLTQVQKHLPADTFANVGKWVAGWANLSAGADAVADVVKGAFLLTVYWLFLWWLYAKRVFVRI